METRDEERRRYQSIMLLALLLTAVTICCAKTSFQIKQTSTTGIEAGEGITVVLDCRFRSTPEEAAKLEKVIGRCVADAMEKRHRAVRFIDPDQCRHMISTSMDNISAPNEPELILMALGKPQVRDAVKKLNLRYLISVRESTYKYDQFSGIDPLAASMGGGYTKRTKLMADVIDMRQACVCGTVESIVDDKAVIGIFFYIPIFIPAMTESRACKNFGAKVAEFILEDKGDKTTEEQSVGNERKPKVQDIIPAPVVTIEKSTETAEQAATVKKTEMPTIATQEKPPEPQQKIAPTQAPPSTAPMVQAKMSPVEQPPGLSKQATTITSPAFPTTGTRYSYRVQRLGESRVEKYVVLGEGVWEGKKVHQVELESKQGLVLFDLKTGNWMRTVVSGKTVGNADPYEDIFRYPLEVGKKYQCEFFYFDYILSGNTKTNIEVSAFEDVSVPAGTFMAYKIIAEEIFIASGNPFSLNVSTLGQQIRAKTFWYSPDLKIVIKIEDTDRRYSITTRTELMEYSKP